MAKGIKTGGRKKGSLNKRTKEIMDKAAASGPLPLAYMLQVMRDEQAESQRRDDMAKAAAPYIHPKLASTEMTGKDGGPLQVNLVNYNDPAQLHPATLSATHTKGAG